MIDVAIVGSGAAGAAAALELTEQGIKPLILDVGYEKTHRSPEVEENLYSYRERHNTFDLLIGDDFSGLRNLIGQRLMPVKLTSPHTKYVTEGANLLSPIEESEFSAIQSFARGGLANAWGGGLYRYTDDDLKMFPIRVTDLNPYFDKLTIEVGISGTDDDLRPFFGSSQYLLPPLRLSYNASKLFRAYQSRKRVLHKRGFHLGRPRVGILSKNGDSRSAFRYQNLEFCQEVSSIYSPRFTIDRLIADGKVNYENHTLVQSWEELDGVVTVECVNIRTGHPVSYKCRMLVLAAGAINTTKIVLSSFRDYKTRLHLLENPALMIPLVLPSSIGRRLDSEAFGLVQLNVIWQSEAYGDLLQGSVTEITSPMRAEFFASLPYSAHANLGLIRYLIPAMMVLQLYFPASAQIPNTISVRENGNLEIQGHPNSLDLQKLKPFLKYFRSFGGWSHTKLVIRVPTGHAIHYAGTLPMKEVPGRYQCDHQGRLDGAKNVFIADSASFSDLPAKNMSFTMMANAMRVMKYVVERLGSAAA